MDEFVYEKLWSELSRKDKEILISMAQTGHESVGKIRECMQMNSNDFSKYRLRLIRKGIADGSDRGQLRLLLPMFKEFVLDQIEYSDSQY